VANDLNVMALVAFLLFYYYFIGWIAMNNMYLCGTDVPMYHPHPAFAMLTATMFPFTIVKDRLKVPSHTPKNLVSLLPIS